MVDAIISKTERLFGEVAAPSSKAYTQRMVIASALSEGTAEIEQPLFSEDTEATVRAASALGVKITKKPKLWVIEGRNNLKGAAEPIDCGESGATLRFMIPVAALAEGPSVFQMGKPLEKRPIQPLLHSLFQLGALAQVKEDHKGLTVHVRGGGINGGRTVIAGNISSQFISGLMFACPKAQNATEILLATPLESQSYAKMTETVIAQHQIKLSIQRDFRKIVVPSNQIYKQTNHKVPGDFSSIAFLMAAAAITKSNIMIKNLDFTTIQGDKVIIDLLQRMGVKLAINPDNVEISAHQEQMKPLELDAKDTPDLVPVCAILACYAKGTSKIFNAIRLRLKESDRLQSLYLELKKMGAEIEITEDTLTIKGSKPLHGAIIDSHNDHRIAMALAIAALGAEGETVITHSESVRKSYPNFFEDLRSLGVDVGGGKFDR